MTKESARKCSHCGHNGHNSRTCTNGKGCSFKLFGVRIQPSNNVGVGKEEDHSNSNGIEPSSIRKSKSMGNLSVVDSIINVNEANSIKINEANKVAVDHGYLSDDNLTHQRRRKGTSWSEDEHINFLVGLKKLGKGDWRGISRKYVPTRTPTQVASHAQKYFIRMAASSEKRKRRTSVFDMPLKDERTPSPQASPEGSLQLSASKVTNMKTSTTNIQGQASSSKPPTGALSEKPPLSPVAPRPFSVPEFTPIPDLIGYPRMTADSYHKYRQTLMYAPVLSYTPHNGQIYPMDRRVAFTACSPFMAPPLVFMPLPNGSSQADKKEGLAAGIEALSI